jgi:protein gp37
MVRPFGIRGDGAVIWTAQMSDLFHPSVPDVLRDRIVSVISRLPQHIFVVTTKRPRVMQDYLADPDRPEKIVSAAEEWDRQRAAHAVVRTWPLPNLCVGVSFEDQQTANEAMPVLMETAAAKRLAWVAPILGGVDLSAWPSVDWIVCRGEEGEDRRPPQAEWIEQLRAQAVAAGIPFHFRGDGTGVRELDGVIWKEWPSL